MTDQPPPTHDARSQPVYDRLLHEIEQQRAKGLRKYRTELTTFNGRVALLDALQEAVDMLYYLTQDIMELEYELAELKGMHNGMDELDEYGIPQIVLD
jgi:hypothetical protein